MLAPKDAVDFDILWDILKYDLPPLIQRLDEILHPENPLPHAKPPRKQRKPECLWRPQRRKGRKERQPAGSSGRLQLPHSEKYFT
jgi:hypothetical protein